MAGWDWLTKPRAPYTPGFVLRVLLKALLLFIGVNLLFAVLEPLPLLGRISVYNGLVQGRPRLPYGENPAQSYNLSLVDLDMMFASHEVARPKPADEYRVLLIGDSSTWGILLRPEETLAGVLNAAGLSAPDGRGMRFYNLGHPVMSLTKDLLILDYALRYEPDALVWVFTAQSFPGAQQLSVPLAQQNPQAVRRLIAEYELALDPQDARLADLTFADRSLVGRRREIANWLRLQLYGFAWNATGIDQYYPESYQPRSADFDTDVRWQGFTPEKPFTRADLAFDVLAAGIAHARDLPVLLVNEPMFISGGQNSDLRYNFFYPRWAYDRYRAMLRETAAENGWPLLDLWDAIAPDAFTDSPVHLTPEGSAQMARLIAEYLASGAAGAAAAG